MIHIVHLSTVHPADDHRIFWKECVTLKQNGFRVTLIAVKEGPVTEIAGVTLMGLPRPKSRVKRFLVARNKAFQKALELDADLYHLHDPELIPVGVRLKRSGKRVILDVHEDLPGQVYAKAWIPAILRRPVSKWTEKHLLPKAFGLDAIIAATPAIARRFPSNKTVVVRNFPILTELDAVQSEYGCRPNNVISIEAALTKERGIIEAMKAVSLIPMGKGAKLIIPGQFQDQGLQEIAKDFESAGTVDFPGWLSRDGIRELVSHARVGLLVAHEMPNHLESLPVKMFEYMAGSVPIVASDFPLWRDIISRSNCGLLVNPHKPEEIAKAVEWLLENPEQAREMGVNGRRAAEKEFNWGHEAIQLIDTYKRVLGA